MRTLLAAFLIATSVPALAGSIQIIYKNDAGTTLFSPSATVNNADAAKFIAWCQKNYAGNPLSVTQAGCFNAWANDVLNQLKNNVNNDLQATAAAAAVSVPIVVTPQQ